MTALFYRVESMNRIVLIGPMGAGKTAIGRRLARKLHWEFADTDLEIQQRTGVDIPFIFDKEGEAGFRRRESRAIAELLSRDRHVIATGGGAVIADENRELMSREAIVVFLAADVDTQLDRTRRGKHRPLLEHENPRQVLDDLYVSRLPLYQQAATMEIETDGQHVETVARRLFAKLQEEYGDNLNA